MQGLYVVSVNRHKFTPSYVVLDDKLERSFWENFVKITDYLDYMSSKCKWEQQGEFNARKYFPEYIDFLWTLPNQPLADIAKGPIGSTRPEMMILAIKGYLDNYHSDYRWMVKMYPAEDDKI